MNTVHELQTVGNAAAGSDRKPVVVPSAFRLRIAAAVDQPRLEELAAALRNSGDDEPADLQRILSPGSHQGLVLVLESTGGTGRFHGYGYYLHTVPGSYGRAMLIIHLSDHMRDSADADALLLSLARAAMRVEIAVLLLNEEADRIAARLALRGRTAHRSHWWRRATPQLDLTLDDRRLRATPAISPVSTNGTREE